MTNSQKRNLWLSLSPWAILASLAILGPMAFFLTANSINRDKENMTRLLVEKGAALIRSFEAGARTGMMGMGWGTLQVERLLVETARQSDILYLVVTDEQGITLAHSDPSQVGKRHPTAEPRGPASAEALEALETVKFRQVQTEEGELSFEVYKRFMPVRGNESRRGLDRLGMMMFRPPPPQG